MNNRKILIIGNGIAGITAARHIRKQDAGVEILVVSGESDHFFSRTALMYIYMGHMKYAHTKPYEDRFWEKNRINLKRAWVERVDFKGKKVECRDGSTDAYDVLILATGSKPNKFGWPGQDLQGVQGLYSLQDLERMEQNTQGIKKAVIVGGGLIGIEMAEMLASRKIDVTFLVREQNFWDNVLPKEEAQLIGRHIREHHIDLRLGTELGEIIGDSSGRVKAVSTKSGEKIDCQFVGLTVGVSPNIEFLRNSELDTNRGILVNEFFQTNIPEVYAIGDCAEFKQAPAPDRRNIEQVWYTGRMHGETLAYNLTHSNSVPYKPGIWFNSAKFFDIEYQTYGTVPTALPADWDWCYWEDPKGKRFFRIVFGKSDKKIKGVNALGWRLRHAYFDKAIAEGWMMEKVLLHLQKANFDPEFYDSPHKAILAAYNEQYGKSLQPALKSLFQNLFGTKV
jgi:NADPH-dependent 2,4-dienoyl-CoA reductase/sulfur reductase-like enzyme